MAQLHELNKTISDRILTGKTEWDNNKGETRADYTEIESNKRTERNHQETQQPESKTGEQSS